MKLGIIREGKTPPDKRVPLSPNQCTLLMEQYPHVQVFVQKSPIRIFKDEEYTQLGIPVVDNLQDCDIIMGVKEVNIEDLIPNKHFFFFSHTLKKQPYNRKLLQAVVKNKIQLTDYEVLKNKHDHRIIGFGRFAGIVGCYNAFLTYGLKHNLYKLKPANLCFNKEELEQELSKVLLPKNTKIVVTGFGRVGHGIQEILNILPITEVTPEEYLTEEFDEPVYTHLNISDYVAKNDGQELDLDAFYSDGSGHISTFPRYLSKSDMFIAGHFWKSGSPYFFTKEDLNQKNNRLSVVADISCDVNGPIATTIRASTIENPIYGYDPSTGTEVDFMDSNAIAVMAVDNLPCELSRDASEDFGSNLIQFVFPALFGDDPDQIIFRGTETTKEGELTPHFKYLEDYLNGVEKEFI
ncbi:MAG: alanine dehydrogenase [Brumimicrobium sp.]|nr:alanine dehydrogenase [Brumimicrobium sp.]MCO5268874.1 NAD(P)-dependent oxidoreductase [Brumimicrobium sp.]